MLYKYTTPYGYMDIWILWIYGLYFIYIYRLYIDIVVYIGLVSRGLARVSLLIMFHCIYVFVTLLVYYMLLGPGPPPARVAPPEAMTPRTMTLPAHSYINK